MNRSDGLGSNYKNMSFEDVTQGSLTNAIQKTGDSPQCLEKIDKTRDQVIRLKSFGNPLESNSLILSAEKNEQFDNDTHSANSKSSIETSNLNPSDNDIDENADLSDEDEDIINQNNNVGVQSGEFNSAEVNYEKDEAGISEAKSEASEEKSEISKEKNEVGDEKSEVSEEKSEVFVIADSNIEKKKDVAEKEVIFMQKQKTHQEELNESLIGLRDKCQGIYTGKTSLVQVIIANFAKLSENKSLSKSDIFKLINTHINALAQEGKLTKHGPKGELIPLTELEVNKLVNDVEKHLKNYVNARVEIQKTIEMENRDVEDTQNPRRKLDHLDSTKPSLFVCTKSDNNILNKLNGQLNKILVSTRDVSTKEISEIQKMVVAYRILEAMKEQSKILQDRKHSNVEHKILNREIEKREVLDKELKQAELHLSDLKKHLESTRLRYGDVAYTQLIYTVDASLKGIRTLVILNNSIIKQS